MSRDLKNIRFKRVALVDKGANLDRETQDGAHILLWKRHTEKKEIRMKISEFIKNLVGAVAEPDATKRAAAVEGLKDVVIDPEVPVVEKKEDAATELVKLEVSKATSELAKKNDELEKRLKVSEELNKSTGEILKAERTQRLHTEMVTVLKSFKATPFNIDEKDEKNDVKKFLKMQEADPEGYTRMIELFKAADVQAAQHALFQKQIGSPIGGVAGSAEAQLTAKADALIQKDGKLSKAAAFDQVCMEHPELVKQYRAEQQ